MHVVQKTILHQLIVQHTFDLCPYIHNIVNYILVFINIICINIAMVHPHNNKDNEHHLHQNCSNSTIQLQGLNKQNSQELKTCLQMIVYTLINPFIYFHFLFVMHLLRLLGLQLKIFHSMYCCWPCVLSGWKLVQMMNLTTCSCPQS